MSTTGIAQEPQSQPSKTPSGGAEEVPSKPLTASGRKNFVRERPHTTSSKQRSVSMLSLMFRNVFFFILSPGSGFLDVM